MIYGVQSISCVWLTKYCLFCFSPQHPLKTVLLFEASGQRCYKCACPGHLKQQLCIHFRRYCGRNRLKVYLVKNVQRKGHPFTVWVWVAWNCQSVYELSATIVFTAELGSVVWWTGFKGPVGLAHTVKGNNNIHSSFPPETGFTYRP